MDREHFDALTRRVSARGSRRLALAGLFGATLLSWLPQATEASCRGKKGKNKRQCWRRGRNNGRGIDIVCQDKLFGLCTYIPGVQGNPCCNGLACTPSLNVFVTACQYFCETDNDCARKFPHKALACRQDLLVCPGGSQKCCVPR